MGVAEDDGNISIDSIIGDSWRSIANDHKNHHKRNKQNVGHICAVVSSIASVFVE